MQSDDNLRCSSEETLYNRLSSETDKTFRKHGSSAQTDLNHCWANMPESMVSYIVMMYTMESSVRHQQ